MEVKDIDQAIRHAALMALRKHLTENPKVEIAHVGGPAIEWVVCKVTRVGDIGFEWVNETAKTIGELGAGFMTFTNHGKFWRHPGAADVAPIVVESGTSLPEHRMLAKQHEDWTLLVDRLIAAGSLAEADREVADRVVAAALALHDVHVAETSVLVLG